MAKQTKLELGSQKVIVPEPKKKLNWSESLEDFDPRTMEPTFVARTAQQKKDGKKDYWVQEDNGKATLVMPEEVSYLCSIAKTAESSPLLTEDGAIAKAGDTAYWNKKCIIGRKDGVLYC